MFTQVQEQDLEGKGVVGQPAVPGLSVEEMQQSVEQIVREVAIPAVNRLVEELAAATAAQNVGAQMPQPIEGEGNTVQSVLAALAEYARTHAESTQNPHGVTAGQANAYTKAETEARIDAKMIEIGAGDMAKSVYDPQGRQSDVFAAIPNENLLINGGFEVWQRGMSFGTIEAASYTADRWTNGSGCSLFQKTDDGAKQVGAAATSAVLMQQTIEHADGTFDFTLSACIKSDGPFALRIASGETTLESETFPACTEFTTVSASFSGVAVSGGRVGAALRSKLTTASRLTVECRWMKLEHGLVATPWQSKGYGAELADCLRFFERIGGAQSGMLGGLSKVDGASIVPVNFYYYPKRKAPAVTFSGVGQYRLLFLDAAGGVTGACSVTQINQAQPPEASLAAALVTASNATGNAVYAILQRQDSADSAWVDISAEL